MRSIILSLCCCCLLACQNPSEPEVPNPQQEEPSPREQTQVAKAPNKGIDTLIQGNRYRIEIVDGEKDQLKLEKIVNGQSKSLTIEAPKDRLYLSAILFDQKPQPRFAPLHVFSKELFAFGTFDQQLQKVWLVRDFAEGLKIEEFDANQKAIVNRGRYLIYVPEEEILAIPQIPTKIEGQDQTIVHRYKINQDNQILRLRPDTVVQQ